MCHKASNGKEPGDVKEAAHLTTELSGRPMPREYAPACTREANVHACALAPAFHGPLQRKLGIARPKLLGTHRVLLAELNEASREEPHIPERIRIRIRMPVKGTVRTATLRRQIAVRPC